jgi:hypothetical protein
MARPLELDKVWQRHEALEGDMGRRSTAKGRLGKTRRTLVSKARKTPTAADLQKRLDEALQQQTATSEVLGIIRRSPADAQPVFDAIVQSAARLCGAIFGVVYLYDGDRMRIAATRHFSSEAMSRIQGIQELKRPERSHLAGRAILDRAIVHVRDVLADPEYSRELAIAGGWRAVLSVPLLRDGEPVGALSVAKAEPTPFSDRQIHLLSTFADQALIAIENVRLFEAEKQRTAELSESLQQQTATADVLKVISRSTFELQVVLDTLVESAARLCRADRSTIRLLKDNIYHEAATATHSNTRSACSVNRSSRGGGRSSAGSHRQASPFTSLTAKPIRTPSWPTDADPGTSVRPWAYRYCAKERLLVSCFCSVASSNHLPTKRSNLLKHLPTKPS